MKKVLFGLLLSAFLFQPGRGAVAHATGRVPSHAYLYTIDPEYCKNHPCPLNYREIVIVQPGTARLVSCGTDLSHPATSPADLMEILNKPGNCIQQTAGSDEQVFYQSRSGRYVFISTSTGGGSINAIPAVSSFTFMTIFEEKGGTSLNSVIGGIDLQDGKNPKNFTVRLNEVLMYDADIDYPEITEKPVQQ
jgi:hypothetical protein